MNHFISGATMMGFLGVAALFLRFRLKSHEPIFSFLAAAFVILAVERVALVITVPPSEVRPFVYLFRLCAFGLIALGVFQKNYANRSD